MHARVNGATLFFDVVSSELDPAVSGMIDKPTIIALHGGPGLDHTGFRPWLDPLGRVAQLIYLDHRGNGRSSRHESREYTIATMADDVEALRQHLGLGPVVLLGHSFGGKIAQEVARRHPHAVAGLILVDTSPGAQFGHDAQAAAAERATPEQLAMLPRIFRGEITTQQQWDEWWDVCLPLYFADPDPTVMKEIGARVTGSPEVARHMMRHETPNFDTRSDLPAMTMPALIIVGRHDWVTPVGQSEEMARLLPAAELLIVEESGHMVHVEQTGIVLSAIEQFLRENIR